MANTFLSCQGINSQTVKDSSIVAAFLPSFFKSITEREWNKFEFVLYVAFDQGDPLWDDALHFATLNDHVKRMNFGIHTLVVKYVRMPPNNGWLTYIWNFLFALAIYDDCEYFYQLNDDLDFNNAGWASQLTDALNNMGGYGVAGPNDLSHNCDILTQSMVTRTHWEIFGWLYPPEIKDWFSDLWLTQVYGKNYTYCLQSVVIDNLRNKGERYQKCNTPLWTQSLQRGQEKIIAWRDEHETIV